MGRDVQFITERPPAKSACKFLLAQVTKNNVLVLYVPYLSLLALILDCNSLPQSLALNAIALLICRTIILLITTRTHSQNWRIFTLRKNVFGPRILKMNRACFLFLFFLFLHYNFKFSTLLNFSFKNIDRKKRILLFIGCLIIL